MGVRYCVYRAYRNIIEQWGDYDVQIRRLAEIKETADKTRPANYAGYLMNALKNYK